MIQMQKGNLEKDRQPDNFINQIGEAGDLEGLFEYREEEAKVEI